MTSGHRVKWTGTDGDQQAGTVSFIASSGYVTVKWDDGTSGTYAGPVARTCLGLLTLAPGLSIDGDAQKGK
jgi:hypothetical protein